MRRWQDVGTLAQTPRFADLEMMTGFFIEGNEENEEQTELTRASDSLR
jgi:hypothetical protein